MSFEPVIAVVVAAAITVLILRGGRAATYVRRAVLTDSELRFFLRLVDAVGEGDYVCPQLGMAAALETRGGNAKAALVAFRKISQKRIDFCVCDTRLVPKFVVELDDHTHDPARDRARDELLLRAGIRTLRFDVRRMPTTPQLRLAIATAEQGSFK
jgi:Protein of unknown function (DUF2726)